jgi:hypothetical protein
MPIIFLDDYTFTRACANCGATRVLSLDDLDVGDADEASDVPMRVPRCLDCGTIEFLLPSPRSAPPHPDPGSYGHLHRLLVDELSARRLAPDSPPDNKDLARWFPDGLTLSRPAEFQRKEKETHNP